MKFSPTQICSVVSILVIMELALEAAVTETKIATGAGFNPCYYGIGFRRARDFKYVNINVLARFSMNYFSDSLVKSVVKSAFSDTLP